MPSDRLSMEPIGSSHLPGHFEQKVHPELDSLIVEARTGSSDAIDRLVEQISIVLWNELHARRRKSTGKTYGSSDLVQDTLVRIRQQFEKFERNTFADFKQWARAILYHRRLELERNQQTRNTEQQKRMVWSVLSARKESNETEALHEQVVERQEEAERAFEVFESLKPNEQFIIELRLFHGLAYKQVAEMTGLSEDASRVAYNRAIAKLKSKFELHDEA